MAEVDGMTDALAGVRVIDFSRQMSGPYGTLMLGDFGAEVIKVESIPSGDAARRTGRSFIGDESTLFMMWNRNKRSICLDLRQPEGKEIVRRMVRASDVLVENYRPGVAKEAGIGYEAMSELNERLVYCSVSAWGQTGPLAQFPGTDPVVQALSGIMSVTGEKGGGPVLVGVPIADFTSAMALVQGALLGLHARERTGRGQYVDVPMIATMLFALTTRLGAYWTDGEEPTRNGAAHSAVAPYQAFRTADGEIVAGSWAPETWPRFCLAIEMPALEHDSRFATNQDRLANLDDLLAIVEPRFLERTTAEWEARFNEANGLAAEVASIPRALSHPQVEALDLVTSVEHPTAGLIQALAPHIRLSDTPGRIRRPAPLLGEHTVEILDELGYDGDEVGVLLDKGVVQAADA